MKHCLFIISVVFSINASATNKSYILEWSNFNKLTASAKAKYIQHTRKIMVEFEREQSVTLKNRYAAMSNLFFKVAYAQEIGPGSQCVYAGHLTQLVSLESRLVCQRPDRGPCAANEVHCNPVLFGANLCVAAGSLSTYSCNEKAVPAKDLAESLTADDWKQLAKINEYCHQPLEFQKLICDKFYETRMAALNEYNPCDKKQTCDHNGIEKTVIQICELQEAVERLPANSVKCELTSEDVDLAQIKECLKAAIIGAIKSATFIDEILDLLEQVSLDLSKIDEESAPKQTAFSTKSSGQVKSESVKTVRENNRRILENFKTQFTNNEKYREQVLEDVSRTLYGAYTGKDVTSGDSKNTTSKSKTKTGATKLKSSTKGEDLPIAEACENPEPIFSKDICELIGGMGPDVIAIIASGLGAGVTAGGSLVITAAKTARLMKRLAKIIAKLAHKPEIARGLLKVAGVSENVIGAMLKELKESSEDQIRQYLIDQSLCRLGNEDRCSGARAFECVLGVQESCAAR